MALSDFTGLARYDALQARPFGASRTLAADRQTSSLRALQEDYNTASRVLRRQARRGDADSALKMIELREKAMEKGFAPGGIREKEQFDQNMQNQLRARQEAAQDYENAAKLRRQQAAQPATTTTPAGGTPAAPAAPAAPADPGRPTQGEAATTATPAPTMSRGAMLRGLAEGGAQEPSRVLEAAGGDFEKAKDLTRREVSDRKTRFRR